jgi:hypothetical protein
MKVNGEISLLNSYDDLLRTSPGGVSMGIVVTSSDLRKHLKMNGLYTGPHSSILSRQKGNK